MQIDPELFSAFADYLRPENTLTWRLWKRDGVAGAGAGSEDKKKPEVAASEEEGEEEEAVAKEGEGTRPPALKKKERWCVCVYVIYSCIRWVLI